MRFYPVALDLKNRPVVIVGGGGVAARKALRLVAAKACLTVVAPSLDPVLVELVGEGKVQHIGRSYQAGDLSEAFLAFAATDDPEVNLEVAKEARRRRILVDVTDAPDVSDFATPAVLERGDLLVTVSTSGASPALARRIIEQLEPLFGEEYGEALVLFRRIREKMLTEKLGDAYNGRVFAELAARDIPALIKEGRTKEIEQILLQLVGPGVYLDPKPAAEKDRS